MVRGGVDTGNHGVVQLLERRQAARGLLVTCPAHAAGGVSNPERSPVAVQDGPEPPASAPSLTRGAWKQQRHFRRHPVRAGRPARSPRTTEIRTADNGRMGGAGAPSVLHHRLVPYPDDDSAHVSAFALTWNHPSGDRGAAPGLEPQRFRHAFGARCREPGPCADRSV